MTTTTRPLETPLPCAVPGAKIAEVADAAAAHRIYLRAMRKLPNKVLRVLFIILAAELVLITLIALVFTIWLQDRWFLGLLTVPAIVIAVVVCLVGAIRWYWGNRIGAAGATTFMSLDETAMLRIVAKPNMTWHVVDHIAAPIGQGHGRALRAALAPHLLEQADEQGITITLDASKANATRYLSEFADLEHVGRTWRGPRLSRRPASGC